jgi:hypothetical protein
MRFGRHFTAFAQTSHRLLAVRRRACGCGVQRVGMDTHGSASKLGQSPDE